jgi:hypothetical protein
MITDIRVLWLCELQFCNKMQACQKQLQPTDASTVSSQLCLWGGGGQIIVQFRNDIGIECDLLLY